MVYLIGSLRNPNVPRIAERLRKAGHEVFDEWHSAGPEADDFLRDYAKARGLNHREALQTYAAKNIFQFDKRHIERADVVVLVMKAGLSGGIEFGWALGQGKPGYVLYDGDPERLDVMLQFASGIVYSVDELIERLGPPIDALRVRKVVEWPK